MGEGKTGINPRWFIGIRSINAKYQGSKHWDGVLGVGYILGTKTSGRKQVGQKEMLNCNTGPRKSWWTPMEHTWPIRVVPICAKMIRLICFPQSVIHCGLAAPEKVWYWASQFSATSPSLKRDLNGTFSDSATIHVWMHVCISVHVHTYFF